MADEKMEELPVKRYDLEQGGGWDSGGAMMVEVDPARYEGDYVRSEDYNALQAAHRATQEDLETCLNSNRILKEDEHYWRSEMEKAELQLSEVNARIAELEALSPHWKIQADGMTHYEGCWKEHRLCALARIVELERERGKWKKQ